MPSTVFSSATLGINTYPVHVEVDIDRILPTFTVVGLPDSTVRESKERVLAAIRNAGYQWLRKRHCQPRPGRPPQGRIGLRLAHHPRRFSRLRADKTRSFRRVRAAGRAIAQRQRPPRQRHAVDGGVPCTSTASTA